MSASIRKGDMSNKPVNPSKGVWPTCLPVLVKIKKVLSSKKRCGLQATWFKKNRC